MAEKIKYSRKDLKGPDEFLSAFSQAVEWTRENRSKVLAGMVGILLVVGAVFGTRAYFRWEDNKATKNLWPHMNRARDILQAPVPVQEEQLARLEQFLNAHVNTYPGTKASVYSRYYLGSLSFLRGDYALSEAHFRAGLQTGKAEEIMPYLLRKGLASAIEAKGDYAAASEAYRDAATHAGGALKVQAQIGQARTMDLAGRKKEASALYRQVLTETSDPQIKEFIELKLARLE
jgi:hypothetical protein